MKKANDLKKGQKVKFDKENYYYLVRAVKHPYVICTLMIFGELYYTILDLEKNIRGSGTNEDMSYLNDVDIAEVMLALHKNEQFISPSNQLEIVISDVVEQKNRLY